MIFVLPIALSSDRLKSRKPLLLIVSLMIASSLGLLSLVSGVMVWVAVLLSGAVRDAFMAIFQTMTIETENVGSFYTGTAVGFAMALGSLGNLLAPPIGNSLAALWAGAPFTFWSALSVLGFVCFWMIKESNRDTNRLVIETVPVQAE